MAGPLYHDSTGAIKTVSVRLTTDMLDMIDNHASYLRQTLPKIFPSMDRSSVIRDLLIRGQQHAATEQAHEEAKSAPGRPRQLAV